MNKIYKVVWNAARNCYVVGSEFISKTRRGGGYRSNVRQGSTRKLAVVLTVLALTTGMSSTFVQAANEVESTLVKGTVAEDATGSFAIGDGSKVTSSYENSADAASVDSLAIGTNAEARNRKTVAVGSGAIARGDKSTAIGVGANTAKDSSEALAVGYVANASGNNAVALGNRSIASEDNTVSVGVSKEDATNSSPAMTRRIVNVSDGVKDSDAATYGQVKDVQDDIDALDALAVQYDGVSKSTVTFDGTNGTALKNVSDIVMNTKDFYDKNAQFSFQDAGLLPGDVQSLGNKWNMAIGEGSAVKVEEGTGSKMQMNTVVGNKARITQALVDGECQDVEKSTALGQGVTVAASNAVGVGQGSNVRGEGGVAVGMQANVSAKSGVAVGKQSKVSSDYSIAIGSAASVGSKSENSVAMGYNAGSLAAGGTAIGQGAKVQGSAANGTAIGKGAIVNVNAGNSVALGASSQVQTADIGSDTEYGVVSVGKSGTNGFMRRIVNVADGTIAEDSHDAVTGGQLYTTNQNVADNADKLAAYEKSGIVPGSIVDGSGTGKGNMALGNMSEIEAGDGMDYNTAIGYNAGISQEYVIGKGYENAENSTAIGASARIYGSDSVAVGHQSSVTHKQGVAIGQGAKVESANSVAVGHEAIIKGNAENSIAIGNSKTYDPETGLGGGATQSVASGAKNSTVIGVGGATTSEGAVVLGYEARVNGSAANATAIGKDATIQVSSGNGNVALGAESEVSKADVGDDTAHGVVSIGKSGDDGFTRRIINVADGINATDAATVGQISTITGMDSNKGNVVQYDGEDKSTITFAGANGTKLTNLADGEFKTGSTDAVTAGQLYAAGITPGDTRGNAGSVAMGGGYNNYVLGNNGTAIGYNALANKNAVAIGNSAGAGHLNATAVGQNSNAMEEGATALGQQAWAEVANSTAIGYHADVEYKGDNSVALGANSIVATEDILDTDTAGVVSVGSSGHAFNSTEFNRRIINVADGVNDSDAATYGQVKDVQSSVTALDNLAVKYDTADKTSVTFNPDNKAGSVLNNVNDIVMQVETYNTSGKVSGYKSLSFKDAGIIPGSVKEEIEDSLSLGNGSSVTANAGVAVGVDAKVQGRNSVAIGQGAKATAVEAVAVGHSSDATDQYATALGDNSNASGESSTAVGHNAFAYADNSTALGDGTNVARTAIGSVALGQGSKVVADDVLATETHGVVSVGASGDKGFTRRIINVADGVNDSDAATYGQVKDVQSSVTVLDNLAVKYDSTDKGIITLAGEKGTKLTNLADGEFKEDSTDAVTAGQLYDAGIVPGKAADGSVAIGNGSNVTNINGVAIGDKAKVNYSAENGVAIGQGAEVRTDNATAIGQGSRVVSGDGSVALGQGSMVTAADIQSSDTHGVVSVGLTGNKVTEGFARRLINVADGINDSDAATVGQIKTMTGIDGDLGAVVQYDDESKATLTFAGENGTALKNVSDIELNGKSFAAAGVEAGTSTGTYDLALGEGSSSTSDYAVALGNQANAAGFGSMALGAHAAASGNNSIALGYGSVASEDDVVSVGGYANGTQRRIVNVAAGVNDNDAATVGQIKDMTGLDTTQGNVVQYDKEGNLNVHVGDSGLSVNESSASLSHGGNSVCVGADGTAVTGGLKVTGDLNVGGTTISGSELAGSVADVSTIKEQIGAGTDGKLGLTNEQTTLVGGINANTEAINGVKTIVGDGKLDNGAADLTAGINANSAAIEQNRNAIGALGSRVSDLGEEVDSVGAISAALAGLHPLDYNGTGSKFQISAALGTYDGTQAAAIGGFYHFNRDTLLSIGGSTSFEGDRKTAANVGVTFRVGEGASEAPAVQDTETKQQMDAMKQEIEMLKAELEQLKNKDTEANDKN